MVNKDEILRKAQFENKDEREEQVNIVANKIGWTSVYTVLFFLIIWRSIHNESTADIIMILMAQIVGASLYQYLKISDKKVYLISTLFGIIGFVLSLTKLFNQYGVF